jgi:hypothetical protein
MQSSASEAVGFPPEVIVWIERGVRQLPATSPDAASLWRFWIGRRVSESSDECV